MSDDLISRAEAIKAVKFYETFCDPYPRVIEALEELPSVHLELSNNSSKLDNENGKLISRQDAIDAFCKEGTRLERNGTVAMVEIKQWCVDLLEKLPSVPRKGKWIYEGIRGRFPVCSCSVCGAKENADWAIMQGANFCPNCGARMDMRGDSDECNM